MEIFKPGKVYDFMSVRKYWIGFSIIASLVSLFAILVYPGPNYGTDFRGGTEVEVAFLKEVEVSRLREVVENGGFEDPSVISIHDEKNPNRFLLRVQDVSSLEEAQKDELFDAVCFLGRGGNELPQERCPEAQRPSEVKLSPGGDRIFLRYDAEPSLETLKQQMATIRGIELRQTANNPQIINARDNRVEVQLKSKGDQLMDTLRAELGADTVPQDPLRVEWVGPKAGKQLRDSALKSIGIAIVFIMAYVAFRFDVRFAPGGVVALAHDSLMVVGVFVLLGKEINLTTVAALLTIVGYSINDTVVIYDRIRENVGKHRGKSFFELANISISETLGRTILTAGSTVLSICAFFVWGTGDLKDFALALLIGMVVGTYSTIFIAPPLTEWMDRKFFGNSATQRKTAPRAKKVDAVV